MMSGESLQRIDNHFKVKKSITLVAGRSSIDFALAKETEDEFQGHCKMNVVKETTI